MSVDLVMNCVNRTRGTIIRSPDNQAVESDTNGTREAAKTRVRSAIRSDHHS